MSGIDTTQIRPGDRVTFYGRTGCSTSRRVDAVGAHGVGVWYQGEARFLRADEIRSWQRGPA